MARRRPWLVRRGVSLHGASRWQHQRWPRHRAHPRRPEGSQQGSIAIALHGGGHGKDDFGKVQLRALKRFCEEINQAYEGNVTFHGHSEVALRDCPVYDYRSLLGLDEKGAM